MNRRGSILVGLLWCLVLLSLIVIGILHTSRMDLLLNRNFGDRIQARYLAIAGVEKAKALLYQDARERTRSRQNHSGRLYADPSEFREVRFGRGTFSVFRPAQNGEGGGVVYGVSDEESRLNVNTATAEALAKLEAITPDVVSAIVDWRDPDNAVSQGGAEADYYASSQPPGRPRNGPIETLREMLMIRGISRRDLLGADVHQTGLLPRNGSVDGDPSQQLDSQTAVADTGWAGLLTTESQVGNLNAAGQDRINVQTADETALTGISGITPEIAKAIIAHRGRSQIQNLADLLDVGPAQQQGPGTPPGAQAIGPRGAPRPGQRPGSNPSSGPKVIGEDLFISIADDITVADDATLVGAVNINTASLEVLICLPGVTRELAQAIISHRSSNGFLANVGELLRVPGMSREIFRELAPLVTARSETFRILSEGRTSTGVRQRVQVIVHVGLQDIETLAYREDDL